MATVVTARSFLLLLVAVILAVRGDLAEPGRELAESGMTTSPAAEAAASSSESRLPSPWDAMSKNGCGRFADLVAATADARTNFDKAANGGGLTIFCPADKAVEAFEPAFKRHHTAAGARLIKLVLYHGVPAHYSVQALKVNVGGMSTLATDRNRYYNIVVDYDGDTVTLRSAAPKAATVVRTIVDVDHRVAVHMIDAVLLPDGPVAPRPPPPDADGYQKAGATGLRCSGRSLLPVALLVAAFASAA